MIRVTTHNGSFHADDVFSYAVISEVFGKENVELVRTRDAQVIEDSIIAFDVGGIYDRANGRFDHHQKGGAKVRENGFPYASIGLVWEHYGIRYLQAIGVEDRTEYGSVALKSILREMDKKYIQYIDGADCGHKDMILGDLPSISRIIESYNPQFFEDQSSEASDLAFIRASNFAHELLQNWAKSVFARIIADGIVINNYINQKDFYGENILVLNKSVPWKSVVFGEDSNIFQNLIYVVSRDEANDTWFVTAVPPTVESFQQRKSLPENWAGLRDQELSDLTGIEGCIFCHNGRFICGNKTMEGAIQMAELALRS